MSRGSYTASERRGVLAIAIIAIVTIAAGVGFAFYENRNSSIDEVPVVIEHTELIDSIRLEQQKQEKSSKSKKERKASSKKSSKNKEKKPVRRRSPLDEPV